MLQVSDVCFGIGMFVSSNDDNYSNLIQCRVFLLYSDEWVVDDLSVLVWSEVCGK